MPVLTTLTLDGMCDDVAELLDEPVSPDDDLLERGLDSIGLMRLAARWSTAGADLTFGRLIEHRSVRQWHALAHAAGGDATPAPADDEQVDPTAPFALATMQHAYWVGRAGDQALGGVGAHFYNEFDGRHVDAARLERAVRALVRRHDMLRARFLDDGRQQITPDGGWAGLTVHDLRDLTPADRDRRLAELRDTLSHRSLRVDRGEVFDIRLSLLPEGRTRIHVEIEMLVADAHSFRVLLADLAALYDRPDSPLPPIDYSYPRYLAVHARRREAAREAASAYWRERLPDLPGGPELPVAVAPERVSGHRVTRHHHWLSGTDRDRLAARAREHGVTLPMVFLTAFAEVLAAWSSRQRFLLNLPLYDRTPYHPDVPLLSGDFTNLLLLEVDATDEVPFVDRARRLHEQFTRDVAHGAYSGVDVLRDLARHRADRAVLAPVVFTSALSLGELFGADVRTCFGEPVWTSSQTPQVWLDNQVTEREGGLYLNWDVVAELFPPGVSEAMFDAYVGLLRALVDGDWSASVGLPAAQRAVRVRVNDTAAELPVGLLHEGFFGWAAREPGRTAVLGDGVLVSYGELAERSLRLAGALVRAGVGVGDAVGVCLPKGVDQIAAVLAVLAAGGVYVPVGVDQPAARRDRILSRAGAKVLIRAHHDGPGGSGSPAPVGPVAGGVRPDGDSVPPAVGPVAGDTGPDGGPAAGGTGPDGGPAAGGTGPDGELGPGGDGGPALERPVRVDPAALAYVIFTSGSTGEPKGVEVSHAAAMNTIEAIRRRYDVDADDRVLAVSALDFDLSVFDLFGLLGAGGALVVVTEEQRRDARAWLRLANEHQVTVWQSVPALLDMLLTAAEADGATTHLRLALLGGDWVGLDLAARLTALRPHARLVALGGTTETAIHSTVVEVGEVPAHWRSIPYGRPLPNQRCRVVDGRGRDCPDWVPGELWIGGAGVAAGYRGDPQRTAERFVTHDGTRWYRTGDLGRYWPDGTLEFLGRTDHQVKIRGHRIELGEIDTALHQHPAVRDAVTVAVGASTRRLAAAVTVHHHVDVDDLRAFLADRLPAYMVPEHIAVLDELPLSGNGKIDRRTLAERLADRADRPTELQPPVGPVETALAAVWAELLDVPAVGRTDSFFALGGDSLLATRLLGRMRAAGLAGGQLRQLFAAPTLSGFAAGLRLERGADATATLTADLAHRHDPFPLTDVQRAYWIGRTGDFALGEVGSHWYWEFDGADVDLDRLATAWNRLVRRHEMLRAVIDPDGRQRIQAEVPEVRIPVTEGGAALADLRDRLSHRVADPTRWPLVAVEAVRYGENRVRLAFSFDYIVLDALSIVTVFAELSALYADLDAPLHPIGVSFRDYVLHAQPDEATVAEDRRYWSTQAAELPPAPQLPLAVDPDRVRAPRFVRHEGRLDPARWSALVATARTHGVSPAAVLATAYAEVLSAWSGRGDLTLNLTLFDRREVHPDIDHVLGDFTSLLLVPHRPTAGDDFLTLVRRLQERMWDGMEHHGVSALWVLREIARRTGASAATMPVVFTSALGISDELVSMDLPFGEQIWGASQTPQVWLDNQVMERDGGLLVNWDLVAELFPPGVSEAMFDAYLEVLRALARGDWSRAVPVGLPAAQRAVRERVNDTACELPMGVLHEGFFGWAAREPGRTAVCGDGVAVSYGELAERSLRLAGALVRAGVGVGDAVGVCLPKGVDQIAAVLAVLAAGGVYVPVGVDQPAARRDRILSRAGAKMLIRHGSGAPALVGPVAGGTGPDGGPVAGGMEPDGGPVAGDTGPDGGPAAGELGPDGDGGPALERPVRVDPTSPAYVIFTSGSTGEPKGVEVSHAAAVNTIEAIRRRYDIDADDRVLAVSALDFDLSVFDLFGLLGAGGALVVVTEEQRRDARVWLRLATDHHVTLWNTVPALLDMLLTAAGDEPLTALRLALVSGDWVGLDLRDRLTACRPGARLVALGGATEAAIWSNACEVHEVPAHWRSVPYGHPLPNQRYRVVDGRGRDCPDWVPGELWIGGAGVAAGYRGDPQRTAERFVTHDGTRWYRTGDLGRYWPDGTLEFLGRTDHQVKIRGHRIELGEIEAALLHHPAVRETVAVAVGGTTRRLAAAVTVHQALDLDDLHTHLADRLPAYMIPEHVTVLDELPLTANGKVDRGAVARLIATGDGAPPDEPPRPGLETELGALWAELLGCPTPGRNRNFFGLGGDSLLATRLLAVLRDRYGVDLPMRGLFDRPTIADLASAVQDAAGAYEEGAI
ncbi:non-ribosomal peptide synthetase [Micromonospora humi]|uniref:Phenyloxazoline synthase MbtB n=1 Tax=Micromonospora humi TaxID=745366 RepID=A0A1C5H1M2_9ACTN|nr:non-ribosomal peptide synthetase [Micromonospora humi]SCG39727.1 amino acid adenylation domain-containing protein [Micromonospora humi]